MGWTSSTCSVTAACFVTRSKRRDKWRSIHLTVLGQLHWTHLRLLSRTIKKDLNMGGVVTVKQPKSPLTYVTVPCLLYNSHHFFFLVFSYFIFSSFSQHCFNVCWCSDHQLDTRLERPSRCQSISAFQFFGVPLSTEDFCAVAPCSISSLHLVDVAFLAWLVSLGTVAE